MKTIRKTTALLAATAIGLLATVGSVSAFDATTNTWLNVRPGPGVGSGEPVDVLPPGEVVDVQECLPSNWCRIVHPDVTGWINIDYVTPVADSASSGPIGSDCQFSITIGPGGPRVTLTCGGGDGGGGVMPSGDDGGMPSGDDGDGDGGDGDEPEANRVCFYDGPNFTDESICRAVGTYRNIGPADDRITSIRLYGDAKVRICERPNMGPYCRDVTTSEGQLGEYLNDEVSSFRVYIGTLPPLKQACFFDGENYTGEHYCLRVGTRNNLGAWDNRVRSMAVFAGASVTLCYEPNMGPVIDGCYTFNENRAFFTSPLSADHDGISSLRVQ